MVLMCEESTFKMNRFSAKMSEARTSCYILQQPEFINKPPSFFVIGWSGDTFRHDKLLMSLWINCSQSGWRPEFFFVPFEQWVMIVNGLFVILRTSVTLSESSDA